MTDVNFPKTIEDACTDFGLRRRDCAILLKMCETPGRFVSFEDLVLAAEEVTGRDSCFDSVRKAIAQIRNLTPWNVQTKRGVGYRIVADM